MLDQHFESISFAILANGSLTVDSLFAPHAVVNLFDEFGHKGEFVQLWNVSLGGGLEVEDRFGVWHCIFEQSFDGFSNLVIQVVIVVNWQVFN